ncbi:phosphatidate cytidylyltransferase [Spongiibacter sp. KMU-158]|uniref:Phosphatidate cytidylyltransferase n=1 Tax=Spongiibacter pelagi TaxID=2760804 RepID=A0A927GVN3_9GAMM|nr:phosphatidate cytidylyltransferase [Spongiibacter pelagi]MBD2858258.1 phosphatidate cytidylyltransferase [Spongiibacter pelagi]
MLKQRVITAVVLVLALLATLFLLPTQAQLLVFAAVVLIAAWEWSNLAGIGSLFSRVLFVMLCGVGMIAAMWQVELLSSPRIEPMRQLLVVTCTWWAVGLLWVKGYPASTPYWGNTLVRSVMGVLVLVPAWLSLAWLLLLHHGVWLLLLLIVLVAAADIGAYFAGRKWGVAKLAPNVSPGKSWAGFWGGVTASLLVMVVVWLVFSAQLSVALLPMMFVAAFTVLASVLGDLLESMVKRHRGIKDSSQILPGHGGVMDRVDSLTAAAPVFTLGLIAVGLY